MLQTILFAPLLGSILAGLFHKQLGERFVVLATITLLFVSAIFSWVLFLGMDHSEVREVILFKWIESGLLSANWAIRLDTLTGVMLVVINTISAFVHLYSVGYMAHDPHWGSGEIYKPRFFSYLSLFTFAMLMLVTSNNLAQLFFGWEGVGLASYLLIGFYYKKGSANRAAIKAFVVNRAGDFGLALAIFSSFFMVGSLQFNDLFVAAPKLSESSITFLSIELSAIEFIAFLFFLGAMGKSAQLFLHTWLPDAMEGPTPVSALIHAATMVTAGVFLVCRLSPIMEYAPHATNFITIIGVATSFFAGTVALVQNDIKRVIAFSTCSQLGFMFAAAGIGLYQAAMFHLFTHAFFKALLFLCAGSIINSMHHEQDIRYFGGLRKKLPIVFWSMIIGTLAITGVGIPLSYDLFHLPLGLSGFVSKDAILEGMFAANTYPSTVSFWFLLFSTFLTSLYSWRLIILTFLGAPRGNLENYNNAEEKSKTINITLACLSLGSIFAGVSFFNVFLGNSSEEFFSKALFIHSSNHILHDLHYIPHWAKVTPFLAMLLGCLLSFLFFYWRPQLSNYLARNQKILHKFLQNKWYFDEIYDYLLVRSARWFGTKFWKIGDERCIDGFINFVALNLLPKLTALAGKFQSGYIFHYAFAIFVGLTAILTYFLISLGN